MRENAGGFQLLLHNAFLLNVGQALNSWMGSSKEKAFLEIKIL